VKGSPRRGSPPPTVRVRGYYPRKVFENSDAKSCTLVAYALISGLPRKCIRANNKHVKKLGDQYIVGPQHKSWESVSPVPTVAAPQYACRGIALLLKLACYAIRCRQTNIHTMRQTNRRTRSFYPRRPTESTYAVNFAFGCRR